MPTTTNPSNGFLPWLNPLLVELARRDLRRAKNESSSCEELLEVAHMSPAERALHRREWQLITELMEVRTKRLMIKFGRVN